MTYAKTTEFWKRFTSEYWEKKPGAFTNLFDEPIATPELVFEALLAAREISDKALPLRNPNVLFIDNMVFARGQTPLLARREDGDLKRYSERLMKSFPGKNVLLHVQDMQNFSYELFSRCRQFIRGFRELAGMPVDQTYLDVWMGDYAQTPSGVHKDKTANFHFVVSGHKRFLTWPYETLQHLLDPSLGDMRKMDVGLKGGLLADEELRKSATIIEGKAGDLLYFPSPYWHVAEGTNQFTVSFHIALTLFGSPSMQLMPLIDRELSQRLPDPGPGMYRYRPDAPAAVPAELNHAVDALVELSRDRLRLAVQEDWLRFQSAAGFSPLEVPPPERAFATSLKLRRDPDVDFVWTEVGEQLVWGANGVVGRLPKSRESVETLERISKPSPFLVSDELGQNRGRELTREAHQGLIEELYRCRTLVAA